MFFCRMFFCLQLTHNSVCWSRGLCHQCARTGSSYSAVDPIDTGRPVCGLQTHVAETTETNADTCCSQAAAGILLQHDLHSGAYIKKCNSATDMCCSREATHPHSATSGGQQLQQKLEWEDCRGCTAVQIVGCDLKVV